MINKKLSGDVIPQVAPSGGVTTGVGVKIGTHLFGVAQETAAQGATFQMVTTGVVTLAKTSALAISIGDLVYWDDTNKVVNKTASSQKLVGIAVSAVSNPSPTVDVLLTPNGVAIA